MAAAQETVTKGDDLAVDVALDGRLVIDLLDSIWVLPAGGGEAEKISAIQTPASRPRWSPLDDSIVYQTTINGLDQIQLYRFASGLITNVGDPDYLNQHPSWHPLGERILFSSDRHQSGFDIWEYDIETGLSWRISHLDGDELDPAWSSDGRDLIYVHQQDGIWSIMLRRFGQPERVPGDVQYENIGTAMAAGRQPHYLLAEISITQRHRNGDPFSTTPGAVTYRG